MGRGGERRGECACAACSDTPRCTCAHLNVGAGLVQGESATQHQCLRAASLQHSKVADVVSANECLLHVHTTPLVIASKQGRHTTHSTEAQGGTGKHLGTHSQYTLLPTVLPAPPFPTSYPLHTLISSIPIPVSILQQDSLTASSEVNTDTHKFLSSSAVGQSICSGATQHRHSWQATPTCPPQAGPTRTTPCSVHGEGAVPHSCTSNVLLV